MSTPPEDTQPISLLCVDDDVNILDVLKKYFEREPDFSVFTCTTPSEALALISQYQFDAIISDYSMPEMDVDTFFGMPIGAENGRVVVGDAALECAGKPLVTTRVSKGRVK